jgi:hypothetical protein
MLICRLFVAYRSQIRGGVRTTIKLVQKQKSLGIKHYMEECRLSCDFMHTSALGPPSLLEKVNVCAVPALSRTYLYDGYFIVERVESTQLEKPQLCISLIRLPRMIAWH